MPHMYYYIDDKSKQQPTHEYDNEMHLISHGGEY